MRLGDIEDVVVGFVISYAGTETTEDTEEYEERSPQIDTTDEHALLKYLQDDRNLLSPRRISAEQDEHRWENGGVVLSVSICANLWRSFLSCSVLLCALCG